ncbi:MAG: hypothetical protein ACRD5J_18065 [Nitrososphaeraceae archaeon]
MLEESEEGPIVTEEVMEIGPTSIDVTNKPVSIGPTSIDVIDEQLSTTEIPPAEQQAIFAHMVCQFTKYIFSVP